MTEVIEVTSSQESLDDFAEVNAKLRLYAREVNRVTNSHKDDPELPEGLKAAVEVLQE